MDDTTQSRVSDATATRKRRSSILKNQRPPRTPFCELEFNVATPPDVTKSRRVSFSRRTGVAEFATNEATTTWKNFYEEQNKSLESSGNDSNQDNHRQTIGHLGNRMFDQQFEEVEVVDYIGSLNPGMNMSMSINNINFAQQLECTDSKLTVPKNNFEISGLTEQQSKLFGDLPIPCMAEDSERININFSAVQQIDEIDDLDEMEKDLQRNSNVLCQGPFNNRQNLSEYIEIDLNMTHIGMKNDESDMSITETIDSPKVQSVSKTASINKSVSISKDWVTDKENIVVNPYVTPRESINFAINEEPDKVLVFDGKKLIVQTENSMYDHNRQSILHSTSDIPPKRKTITINCNDDLPNFTDNVLKIASNNKKSESPPLLEEVPTTQSLLNETQHKHRTIIYDDDLADMSVTQAIPNTIPAMKEKRQTILYENDTGNISITQAIPSKIIDKEKRQTIVYDNCNISITQTIPVQLLSEDKTEKRKTIVFDENEASNISMTQALPANIIPNTKRRTILFEDNTGNLSITQAIPNVIINDKENSRSIVYDNAGNITVTSQNVKLNENAVIERRRTVIFENDTCNISITQSLPSNIIPQKLNATSYENDCNISITQALPVNILLANNSEPHRRRTVVYEDDTGNLSITQAVPSNQVIQGLLAPNLKIESNCTVSTNKNTNIINEVGTATRRRTVVFENDDGNISMTQAVNLNQVLPGLIKEQDTLSNRNVISKRQTIVFENDAANMSVTQAIPLNQVIENEFLKQNYIDTTNAASEEMRNDKRRTIVFDNDDADISMTQAIDTNKLLTIQENKLNVAHDELKIATDAALHSQNDFSVDRRKTIVYDDDEADISMTQALDDNIVLPNGEQKDRTIVFDDVNTMLENRDLFMEIDKLTGGSPDEKKVNAVDVSMTELDEEKSNKKTIVDESDTDNSISHRNVSTKLNQDRRRTVTLNETANSTLSKPIPAGLSMFENEMFDKSHNKNLSKHEITLANITNGISDVIIYQAVTTPDKGDPTSLELISIPSEHQRTPPSNTSHDDDSTSLDLADIKTETQQHIEQTDEQSESSEASEKPELSSISINIPKDTAIEILPVKPKDSTLKDLLNMSHSSLETEEDKHFLIINDSQHLEEAVKPEPESSNDTLFFITKDDEGQAKSSDNNMEIEGNALKMLQTGQSMLPIEYQEKQQQEIVDDVQKKLEEIKSNLKNMTFKNSPDSTMECNESLEKSRNDASPRSGKSFKMANDTNELLEMLSDFADKRKSRNLEQPLEKKEKLSEPLTLKGNLALENKEATNLLGRRLSFLPKRQSIALSREDFLNNISMAGAALQKSRFEIDDTNDLEDSVSESPAEDVSRKKSVRLSNEVVKTLQFDEDSLNDTAEESIKALEIPLKKTAFGEVSYMKESKAKAKVIPEYLTEVSNGIKELMDDLVKPMADVLPFQTITMDKSIRKCPSTCSTQIQANLLTSSQIDLNTELYSNTESMYDVADDKQLTKKVSSVDIITDAVNRSMSRALKSPIKPTMAMSVEKLNEFEIPCPKSLSPSKYSETKRSPGRVLVFDHSNPLNNVLLDPPEPVEAHRYNPIPSTETLCTSETVPSAEDSAIETDKDTDAEGTTVQYRMESTITPPSKFDAIEKIEDKNLSNINKSSTDQWTDPKTADNLKDTEVNTVIAMKGNKELLEASSSLTLVDDALVTSNIEIDSCNTPQQDETKSTVQVIYTVEDSPPEKLESDLTSNDELMVTLPVKSKKRVYSPSQRDKQKHSTLSSLDITPKPASKIQKRSISPDYNKIPEKDSAEHDKIELENLIENRRPGTTVTVQQVITMVHIETPRSIPATIDLTHDSPVSSTQAELQSKEVSESGDCIIESSSAESRSNVAETVSSATDSRCNVVQTVSSDMCSSLSSKNMRDDTSQMSSPSQLSRTSNRSSKMDWLPESSSSGMISKKTTESDTSADIITKIDRMPFMGSHDCEWESTSEDTWSFRLLHSRLRLTVRFCPTTCVSHDTRVLNVALETLHQDKKNPLALLCVNFGAEMMRHLISRGCSTAEEVPKLVRKVAGAARLAARWARAMHDARARLAFTLTSDGWLALKVANTSVRAVWEVTMRLELQVEDARSAPWPRACALRVVNVLPDHAVPHITDKEVDRVLSSTPQDWGHVPRTIWKIFKYLKHKRRDSRMILGMS